MQYRADVDGLRALAVVPVVLFHLGIGGFGGGFVGVDIFFVISGYLITGLIADDLRHGRFTVAKFYERRIRRIFPALFVMLWCVLAAGVALFLPQDMRSLNASLAATTLFVSNIYLWMDSGYFAKAAELQPLLHTWSLAVEEQFYIFFPLFLMLAWRWGKRLSVLVWLVLVASLLLSIYAVPKHANGAFYMLPTRAWELLIGAVIALGAVPRIHKQWLNELFALAGLALILFAVFTYHRTTPFPGWAALPPCLGAGLLIYSSLESPTRIAKLLSLRPVVFIGLISYSLYLWHWPLIVFVNYRNTDALTGLQSLLVLLTSVIFAVCSWRFVERPFRTRHAAATNATPAKRAWSLNPVIGYGLLTIAVSAVVCAIGAAVYSNDHALRTLYNERVYRYDSEARQIHSTPECVGDIQAALSKKCLLGATDIAPTVAVWGDSYIDALQTGLDLDLRRAHLSAGRFVLHACPSIRNTLRADNLALVQQCETFTKATLDTLSHNRAITTVVLFNNYLWYLEEHQPVPLLIPTRSYSNESERRRLIIEELLATIDELVTSGKHVVVVGAYPSGQGANAIARYLIAHRDLPTNVTIARADYNKKVAELNNTLARLNNPQITYVDPAALFCRSATQLACAVVQDDIPLLADGGHLSPSGAAQLADLIVAGILRPVATSDPQVLATTDNQQTL